MIGGLTTGASGWRVRVAFGERRHAPPGSAQQTGAVRVLIVEDEQRLADTLARGLRRHGMAIDVAYDGDAGLEKALVHDYDVVVLDRDLPLRHGDDVCRDLVQARRPCRVLMLTAASGVGDLVSGLELGADDYLGKPFELAELIARLRALARRADRAVPTVLCVADLTLDAGRGTVTRAGVDLPLTARERAVLQVLLEAEGRIVSAETLLEKAWDEHADPFTTSVRVIVSRLRAKLGAPPLITTVVGQGYRIDTHGR